MVSRHKWRALSRITTDPFMSRYQQQVIEMDSRRRRIVRMLSFTGAATIIVVTLWASDAHIGDFSFANMWRGIASWWQRDGFIKKDEHQAVAPQLPTPVSVQSGRSTEPPKPLSGTDSSISKTPLPLILTGTQPGRNATEGTAFLGVAKDNPQTYAAGAILANGARIKEIYADFIVLEKNGSAVKLYVDGKKQNTKALNDLLTVGGQPEVKLAVATHREVLTDYIRPSPVYEGDMLKGYQVYAGQRAGVFSQLGLQNGDVILSLNDMAFTDPKHAIDMFRQLTEGVAMIATVERKGKRERISLDGARILEDQERLKNPPPAPPMPAVP